MKQLTALQPSWRSSKGAIAQTTSAVVIRPALPEDVPSMATLINYYADQNLMLHRSPEAILSQVKHFLVVSADDQLAGCGSLAFLTPHMVEIRSLAVSEHFAGQGIGSKIVTALVERARAIGATQVVALTLRPDFFRRLGFRIVDRWALSPKVWSECVYCPKFHHCDEIAVAMDLQ